MALRVIRLLKEGHKMVVFTEAIPNITLYGGIVVIMMCAIGSQYDVMNMYSKVHTEAVPWVTMFLGDWAPSLDYYKNFSYYRNCINGHQ